MVNCCSVVGDIDMNELERVVDDIFERSDKVIHGIMALILEDIRRTIKEEEE